jgi:integrase
MATISAYQTSKGKRYRVRYRTPDQRQTDKRGFATKRDAELFAASIEVAKSRGEFVTASAGRATVGELAPAWLAAQQTHVKASTFVWLEGAVRVYVEPRWGAVKISEIRHSDVQKWISELATGAAPSTKKTSSPLGASSVRRAYSALAAILDTAVKDRRLSVNPARDVKLPRKQSKRRHYLDHGQVERLALAAGDHGTLVRFLAYSGLRWGEAIALRVSDLDMLRRRVSVHRNAVRVNGAMVVGTPKTHHARSVPFPAFLATPLARLCEGKERDALVFGNGRSFLGQPTHRDAWFTKALASVRESEPDFPAVTVHDLRHTAASLAISSGANVKAVQRMLGHASAAMTLDTYADLFDDDLDSVANALDEARNRADVGGMWAEGARKPLKPAENRGKSRANVAPRLGLEPRTYRLTADCSAN